MTFQVIAFIFFTALVAFLTWLKVRKDDIKTRDGFFLAGRSLTAPVIAGTLLMTNLSSEQLVGQSGQAYRGNMSVIGWEVIAALALVFMAKIFLPKYLKRGLTTIPEFLEERYDSQTRLIVDLCLLIATGICFLPVVLYSGSIALSQLFAVSTIFNISQGMATLIIVVLLGIIGSIYALGGGLKAVAFSDYLNGIGLFFGGLLIPIFGLLMVGSGSISEGFRVLAESQGDKLNAIGSSTDPVPFSTVFTGLVLVNTFYWCTNQGIVQRTLAAKNLEEGQKGVVITAFFKILVPFILVFPGIIAFQINPDLKQADMAYPYLIKTVLPPGLVGFYGAVLFGAILSTFNSFLNSASTLYSLGIYKRYIKKSAEQNELIKSGKSFGIILAIVSIIVAPLIAYAPNGLYAWMKSLNAIYNVPLVTIIIFGFFVSKAPPLAGRVGMLLGISGYLLIRYILKLPIHFLHAVSIMAVLNVTVMYIITKLKPRGNPYVFKNEGLVKVSEWRGVNFASISIISMIIAIYSWLGLFGNYPTLIIAIFSSVSTVLFFVLMLFKHFNSKVLSKE